MNKKIGYIGLGKMGHKMVEHLFIDNGYEINVFDVSKTAVDLMEEHACAEFKDQECIGENCKVCGVEGASNIEELVSSLPSPRTIWIMVPHKFVGSVLEEITPLLEKGDTVIDGGNSPYKESIKRGATLESKGIDFLDAGVSGGPDGAREGACVMVGGKKEVYDKYESLFADISAPNAYGYMGGFGAGHFVKMVHNGIEYGMMQSIGEGFDVLKKSDFNLNLSEVSRVYNSQSVIESRLIGWLENAFKEYGEDLQDISGKVSASGEGKWTVETAKELNVPTPIIEGSVNFREQSQNNPSYTGQVVSALRNQFGGHKVDVEDNK